MDYWLDFLLLEGVSNFPGKTVAQHLKLGIAGVLFCAISGCATVSVYETTKVAEISLSSEQSRLAKATRSFERTITDIGVEERDTAFDKLTSWFGGEKDDSKAYWRLVKADADLVEDVRRNVMQDVARTIESASAVNIAATEILTLAENGGETPSRNDVAQIETVLIGARHARDAFCDALKKASDRSSESVDIDLLLIELDNQVESLAQVADEMAAARMSGALSSVVSIKT